MSTKYKPHQRRTKRAIVAKDPHTDEILYRYRGVYDARHDGYDPSVICKCLRGTRKTHGGLKWEEAKS